jgi:hypothetical protein
MATKVIDNNEARVPFFGDKMSFITGLDPLGIQNPSTQTYSYLLPGLNNVTGHIRYYSFYCWLLSEYAKKIESTDPKEQKKFIRRAEYIVALLSVRAGIPGISGSLYASNRFKEGLQEFDLENGTYNSDGSTINTYWQYSFGIFGQYYLGSLRQIGLIEEPINEKGEFLGIYRRTARKEDIISGEDLAHAFDQNIDPTRKSLFFNCIKKGSVKWSELNTLMKDLNLAKIDKDTQECKLLIELLTDKDEPYVISKNPSSMRKETLIHLLKYAKQKSNSLEQRLFTIYAYDAKGYFNNNSDNCLTGWYYYQLNEYWQVACTAVFNGCLGFLEKQKGPGWMPLHELIEDCTKSVIEYLIKNKYIKSAKDPLASIPGSIKNNEKDLYDDIIKSRMIDRIANGLLMIWLLYDSNKNSLGNLRIYTNERGIGENQDVLTFYSDFVDHIDRQTVSQYISEFLLHHIISRHQYVAYRKMGSGTQSTQKFILEDNYIRQIGNFGPTYTSPRIGNMIAYLHDLNLLTDANTLTVSGNELLAKFE